jgi:gamma-glutamyl hercynylcysteine S-oxide synthase
MFAEEPHASATAATAARKADAQCLAQLLRESRADTLATFAVYEAALPDLRVPQREELNLPLWELGHIGWFQEYWIARNPERSRGTGADPGAPRRAGVREGADALYDSSRVAHGSRWSLALPDADSTRRDLALQIEQTLELLGTAGSDDAALYFFRLALHHEDMHHEAALYMAEGLGIAVADARWQPPQLPPPPAPLHFEPSGFELGSTGPGFVFDNEWGAHTQELGATHIDAQVLRWAEYLPFVEAGGPLPGTLRREGARWLQRRAGQWVPLDEEEPARHLRFDEAQAWCRWAGRRLPSEAEWERAAVLGGSAFRWGDVWEWTASGFAPYPGFVAHPYRDYSAPWFDGRPVLRGGSFMTQPRLKHPRYRNYFPGDRSDVPAGLRTCALA